MATRRPGSTRERLLDVALDLFAEEGFRGTTITEVERRAGLTPGTGSFYRHFASKEDLLRAAVDREVERGMVDVEASRAAAPTLDDPRGRRSSSSSCCRTSGASIGCSACCSPKAIVCPSCGTRSRWR